jgi:hypothetical protein
VNGVTVHLNFRRTDAVQGYAFDIGEHVFVEGLEDEFVVIDVDRNAHTLQLLSLRSLGHIENFPASAVRFVLPPQTESSRKKEAKLDEFSDPPAA